jgi:hypothetical protein
MKMSRRRLMLTASTAAIAAGLATAISVADVYFPTDEKKPQTSFKAARSLSNELATDAIGLSRKYTGAEYPSEEVTDIKNRIWDKTQITMLRFYKPSENE